MITMDIEENDTMPDDAWKDSFEKLLDQRPILRELNVIKRNVRASFNMNSSYENSSYDDTGPDKLKCGGQPKADTDNLSISSINVRYTDVPNNTRAQKASQKHLKSKIVSTPIKNDTANPFICTLSPIGNWEFRHFKCGDKSPLLNIYKGFNATSVSKNVEVNVECIGNTNNSNAEKETLSPTCYLGTSPLQLVRNKWKSKQGKKQVCFAINNLINKNKSMTTNLNEDVSNTKIASKFDLQPGKWRKTVSCLRRQQNISQDNTHLSKQNKQYRKVRSTGVVETPKSLTTAISVAGTRKSICIRQKADQRSTYSLGDNDFKRQILQRCRQRRILSFSNAYNEEYLQNCCKIGEGAFGEVFLSSKSKTQQKENEIDGKTVLKIIPIEGKEMINGEVQKTFEQILPEIIISMELCGLNDNNRKSNVTSGFVNLQRVRYVKGQYPSSLQKLWEQYDLEKESENDHPKCFTNSQQYIVLELGYGGKDLEGFPFKNAEQSFYALQQIILTLAAAENEYQFEHRDLHWGNILLLNTNQQYISYKLKDNILTVPTKGIRITIIDYTLSRMTLNGYCYYNDLSNDEELFTATGDYQFEIYRMMRRVINNKWEVFEPKTNIFWISYIIAKLVEGVTYTNKKSKNHLRYLDKLKQLQTSILTYNSCADCAQNVILH